MTVYQDCLIPKFFINAIAALPIKTEPSERNIITLGGILHPKTTPAFKDYDVDTLTDEVRRIFYRYDCECVPLYENQLWVYRACDEFADIWGLKSSPDSSASQIPTSEPVTTAVDPSPTVQGLPAHSCLRKTEKSINEIFPTETKISA